MKKNSKKEERKSTLKPIILLIAFSAIMFIISTYAWFSTQRAVTITNLSGKVNVAEGLEISLDAANWANEINLSNASLTDVTTADSLGTYSTTANHVPTELIPASTIGATGGKSVKLWTGTFDGTKLSGIGLCDESKTLASEANYAGYYAFDIFLRNSSSGTTDQSLSLSSGSSLTVLPAGEDGEGGGDPTTGLQNTARLAFAKFNATADVRATQDQIIEATVTEDPDISQVAIWEPNANFHVDYIVANASRYSFDSPARNKLMTTYALNDTNVDEIANVYDTGATMSTKLTAQKTIQSSITVPTTDTDEDGIYDMPSDYTTTSAIALTDTSDTPASFVIAANKVTRIRVYLWLEGQDVDCINYASHGGGIIANFGLEKQ